MSLPCGEDRSCNIASNGDLIGTEPDATKASFRVTWVPRFNKGKRTALGGEIGVPGDWLRGAMPLCVRCVCVSVCVCVRAREGEQERSMGLPQQGSGGGWVTVAKLT